MSIHITKINNYDPATSSTFNKPITEIERHLNTILDTLSSIRSQSSVIVQNMPVSNDVYTGCVVYFDPTSGILMPAIAEVSDTVIEHGRYVTSPKAIVFGIVINVHNNVASVLISGEYDSRDCMNASLDSGCIGQYYLSDSKPGKLTLNPKGVLRQPVLTYTGNGHFVVNITHQPPYQYDDSVIRGAASLSPTVAVSVDKGILSIEPTEFTNSGVAVKPYAMYGITGNTYGITPVVTGVSGIGDVKSVTNALGEVFIGDASTLGGKIQADEYNLNGTKRSSDEIFTYVVFPSGKKTSVTISRHIDITNKVICKTWIDIKNTKSDFTVSTYFIPDPKDDNGVPMPTDPIGEGSITSSTSNNNIATYYTDNGVGIAESGTLWSVITADNPTDDIFMVRGGFMVEPSDIASTMDSITVSRCDALHGSGVAAVDINKDQVIGINRNNEVVLASCDNSSIPACGVAIKSVKKGDICVYTSSGVHNMSKAVSGGDYYFVGIEGELISTSPSIPNYSQRIGRAVGSNTILIDIEEVIE